MNKEYERLVGQIKNYTENELCALYDYQFSGYKVINRLVKFLGYEKPAEKVLADEQILQDVKSFYFKNYNKKQYFNNMVFDSVEEIVVSGLRNAEIIDKMKEKYKTEAEISLRRVRVEDQYSSNLLKPFGPSKFISTTATDDNELYAIARELCFNAMLPEDKFFVESYKVGANTPAIAVPKNPKRDWNIPEEKEVLLFKDSFKFKETGRNVVVSSDKDCVYCYRNFEINP